MPGAFRRRHQFHDVRLGAQVRCARQALAIDEHRIKFEPSLEQQTDPPHGGPGAGQDAGPDLTAEAGDPRVKQVWFEGAHSDVGGGYAETGLSDTALGWMTDEAVAHGLVFDDALLGQYVDCGCSATRHDSRTTFYKLLCLVSRIRLSLHPPAGGPAFVGHDRILARSAALGVRVETSAVEHFDEAGDEQSTLAATNFRRGAEREWYHPANLVAFAARTDGLSVDAEKVVVRP